MVPRANIGTYRFRDFDGFRPKVRAEGLPDFDPEILVMPPPTSSEKNSVETMWSAFL